MKKILHLVVLVLLTTSILTLASCTSKKTIETAKEYVDEYYRCINNKNAIKCFYMFNKNSSDKIEAKYGINTIDLLFSRSTILGSVEEYKVTSQNYYKEGTDKYVDFDVLVKYQNTEINEKHQVIIKEDGQIAINVFEFEEDNLINEVLSPYIESVLNNDIESIENAMSSYFFSTRTKRNLESMFEQATLISGNILNCEIIEGSYLYEKLDDSNYVYEALLEMKCDNGTLRNKIKITSTNGELGIGYSMILPVKALNFFEKYTSHLQNLEKKETLSLYSPDTFPNIDGSLNTKWEKLLTYRQAYGNIQCYEVTSIGVENIMMPEDNLKEGLLVEADLKYDSSVVKHKLLLTEDKNGEYVIYEQHISND